MKTREEILDKAVRQTIDRLSELDRGSFNEYGSGLARLLAGNPAAFGHCGSTRETYTFQSGEKFMFGVWDVKSPTAVQGLAGAHIKMIRAAFHRIASNETVQ